jgi:predicted DCC family thiol-disulfide oxidoreductase YuxK
MTHDSTIPAVTPWQVEVFFDGDCPLCRREVAWFRRLDRRQRIRFTDLAMDVRAVTESGIPFDQLMAEIHGRMPDGTWIRGVEVFRRMYSAVGWTWLVAPTRWPGLRQCLDWAYRVFARNRLRLTGRCTTECKVHQH